MCTQVRCLLATMSLTVILAWPLATSVRAEELPAGHGQVTGDRIPFQAQAEVPALTPEQWRSLHEQSLTGTHLPGPRLPAGPDGQSQSATPLPPPTTGRPGPAVAPPDGAATPQSTEAEPSPQAAGTFAVFRATAQNPYSGSGIDNSDVLEPNAATNGQFVFYSGNWFASYSNDGGQTFSLVNPYTQFGNLFGALFCCDQTVTYDQNRDLFAWSLQYRKTGSTSSDKGGWRTAFAVGSAVTSGGWCSYDWQPSSFGLAATGLWLDYPQVSLSNNYIWYAVNVFTTTTDQWQRTVIWRIPLAQAAACATVFYDYFFVSDRFTFTPVQGATTTMYWASHNSLNSIRIYNWPENSNTVNFNDVAVSAWPNNARSCPGPDGKNWCGRADGSHGMSGWVANGVIGFMWNASQGSGSLGTFSYPYVHVARFDENTKAIINEPIIYNQNFAIIYPAVGVNNRGHIAGTLFAGGGLSYPSFWTFIWDDFSLNPFSAGWEVYSLASSTAGTDSRWGDYYSSRRHGSNGNTWVITGQQLSGATIKGWYVWVGRERDASTKVARACFPEFNGDGKSDILWRHDNGSVVEWLMDSNQIASNLGVVVVPADWHIVGTGEFNGDGKTDILWRHDSGQVVMWLMNNNQIASNLGVASVSTDWHIAGTGDFNADGKTDILWRHDSGQVVMWLMNSNQIASNLGVASVSTDWHIVGTGDFNGDGKTDILWRHDSGQVVMWLMNSNQISSNLPVTLVDKQWRIAGIGDFNGDNKSDILWRHDSGYVVEWLMNGNQIVSNLGVAAVNTDWHVVGTGDFNGDGKSDILWRHDSGYVVEWLMNSNQIASNLGVAGVTTDWHIVDKATTSQRCDNPL